jgi:hypothetical protein
MKDVSRGTLEERAAAYRYNRSMRGSIFACMRRWVICCGVALLLTGLFDSQGTGPGTGLDVFELLAAACATFIAFGVCVLFVSAYVYVYLAHNEL